jgi:hypothetical protein
VRDEADAERIRALARELGRVVAPDTLDDVASMVSSRQVEPRKLRDLYELVEPELFRFPAVDPGRLREAVRSLADPS